MATPEQITKLISEFIDLANKQKENGEDLQTISAALMAASATYATYVYAGNDGYLKDSGATKVMNAYEKHLTHIQNYKKSVAKK